MCLRFGLLLNAGEFPGQTHAQIYDLLLAEATLAERLGYHELWLTEHHFTHIAIDPSALTMAAFLLGHTSLDVGTAVTLAPLYHPVQLAEQAALLDHASQGRFHLGLGRGGYRIDFEVFNIPPERWQEEVHGTVEVLLNIWTHEQASSGSPYATFEALTVKPRPRTRPHPPLLIASSGAESIRLAARSRLPLQFYYATPVAARLEILRRYQTAAAAAGSDPSGVDHLHTLPVFVLNDRDDLATVRARLLAGFTTATIGGSQPTLAGHVHRDAQGNPIDQSQQTKRTLQHAIVGTADDVIEQLTSYITTTGATRLALYHELIVDPADTLASVWRFGKHVLPVLRERFADGVPMPNPATA